MMNRMTQEQFEHILDLLILYNQLTPKSTEVFLNERCIKEAIIFMSNQGKSFANELGM